MSKILPAFVAFFVVFLGSLSAVFASTLSLSPSSGNFNRGCSYNVNIDLNTQNVQTDSTDALLTYEPGKFSNVAITNGTLYPEYVGNSVDTQTGKISVSGIASVSQGVSNNGPGVFATLNLTISPSATTGPTNINFVFDSNNPQSTTDSNVVARGTVNDTLTAVTNGSYTIGTGSCSQSVSSPLPSSSPGSGGTTPGGTTPGGGTKLPPGGSSSGVSSGGAGIMRLPLGGVSGGSSSMTSMPGSSSGSAYTSGTLPSSGVSAPTYVFISSGIVLVILGIVGIALL